MDALYWRVGIVTPNKFEAHLIWGILRDAGVRSIVLVQDNTVATRTLDGAKANLVFCSVQGAPHDCFDWIKLFRRDHVCSTRKAPVVMLSGAMTASLVLQCKNAGANALIGQPVSAATLLGVVRKVMAKPRPWVECPSYVGPCRRAGILTAGNGQHRRRSDGGANTDGFEAYRSGLKV